jgi:hypothetical protein
MNDAARKPTPEELDERFLKASEEAREHPSDPDAQLRAGQAAEAAGRRLESYAAYFRATDLDPAKSFLIPRLRTLAPGPQEKGQVEKLAQRPTSFKASFGPAFAYPLRGRGLALLGLGALLVWGLRLLSGFGPYALFPAALAGAFLAMFYVDVLTGSAQGDPDLPEWADVLRLQSAVTDVLKLLVPILVSFFPIVLVLILSAAGIIDLSPEADLPAAARNLDADEDEPQPVPVPSFGGGLLPVLLVGGVLWGLVGMLYLPAGVLCNVMFGNPFACVNVPFVLGSLKRAGRDYALCVAAYYGVSLGAAGLEALMRLPGLFRLGGLFPVFVEIYGGAVLMRVLGIFYVTNRAKLNWMPKG